MTDKLTLAGRTPAAQIVVLAERIREAPTHADLMAIRAELRALPTSDVDAEMLQIGIARRERALGSGTGGDTPPSVDLRPARSLSSWASVRKLVLCRAAPIRPVVSHLPRRVEPQRKTVVVVTTGR